MSKVPTNDPKHAGEEEGATEEHQRQAEPRLGKLPTRFQLSRGVVGVPDVAISIARKACVLVMRSVKLAEALDRREHRPHQKEVPKEFIMPAGRQVAIMRGVVSQDY
jgi:hypothetical protein